MADDGSILAEEKEEAEEAVNESLPEWVTKLALPTLVIQAQGTIGNHREPYKIQVVQSEL